MSGVKVRDVSGFSCQRPSKAFITSQAWRTIQKQEKRRLRGWRTAKPWTEMAITFHRWKAPYSKQSIYSELPPAERIPSGCVMTTSMWSETSTEAKNIGTKMIWTLPRQPSTIHEPHVHYVLMSASLASSGRSFRSSEPNTPLEAYSLSLSKYHHDYACPITPKIGSV